MAGFAGYRGLVYEDLRLNQGSAAIDPWPFRGVGLLVSMMMAGVWGVVDRVGLTTRRQSSAMTQSRDLALERDSKHAVRCN